MALFYNRLCGVNADSDGNSYWTYLHFLKPQDTDRNIKETAPEIWVSDHRITDSELEEDEDKVLNLGKIITSDGENQSINEPFTFADLLTVKNIKLPAEDSEISTKKHYIYFKKPVTTIDNSDYYLQLSVSSKESDSSSSSGSLYLYPTYFRTSTPIFVNAIAKETNVEDDTSIIYGALSIKAVQNLSISGNFGQSKIGIGSIIGGIGGTVGSSTKSYGIDLKPASSPEGTSIYTEASISAYSYNATSDERAKTDFASFGNGLSLINSVPVVNFNYKDSGEPSVGVVAQDILKYEKECEGLKEDFSFVNNKNSSGENGDYMTIKESKLIYVLWDAVRELSKEIEQLKVQIASMR